MSPLDSRICIAVILLLAGHVPANADSPIIFEPIEPFSPLNASLRDFVSEPMIKRHRIVKIDYDAVAALFDTAAQADGIETAPLVTYRLFDDLEVQLAIKHISDYGPSREVQLRGFQECSNSEGQCLVWGHLTLGKKERTIGGVIASHTWYVGISKTDSNDQQLLWEAYIDLLPALD